MRHRVGSSPAVTLRHLVVSLFSVLAVLAVSPPAAAQQLGGPTYSYDPARCGTSRCDAATTPAEMPDSTLEAPTAGTIDDYDDPPNLARTSASEVARFVAPQTGADECDGLPVFMPGGDTPDTTAHIVDALSSNPAWSVLTRAEHPDSTTNRTWYQGDSRCAGEVGDALSCDEYPFHTSRQGGPGASLRLVPGWEQNRQGGYLRNFYAACGIGQGDDYVVAPTPSQPTTTFRC